MKDTIKFIEDIVRRAGIIQLDRFKDVHKIEFKGTIDIVTEVDREVEEFIVSEIHRVFPNDDILAEEGSGNKKLSDRRWIIDPLDGTVNYAHGFPFFCVSVALEESNRLVAGSVYDPNRDELFSARDGEGATLNGARITVSKTSNLKHALLATGFAYNVHEEENQNNLDHFSNFIKTAQAVRRPGSAAIDLCWVASGRIDGFWELFLKPWDMAAGVLIIKEAGGSVTKFDRSLFDLYDTEILATNKLVHEEMMKVLCKL